MNELHITLVSDGNSDAALVPILRWMLVHNGIRRPIQANWADLRLLPKPPRTLEEKITLAVELYPCNILFIHRDAEEQPREKRMSEIDRACQTVKESLSSVTTVYVVPVRMTEAWLLFNEAAIRQAAGNRNGTTELSLPKTSDLQDIPDPKSVLHHSLKIASGLTGRRLKKFQVHLKVSKVSDLIDDFTPLRQLSAFSTLEEDVKQLIRENQWDS